jgi:antirestriction protein ArdC
LIHIFTHFIHFRRTVMAFMGPDHTAHEPAAQYAPAAAPAATKEQPLITDAVKRARTDLAARLVAQSGQGNAPWNQKLDPDQGDRLPYNPFSKSAHAQEALRGVNGLQLASVAQEKGFTDPRWISRAQMDERGWSFKSGERGTNIEFYSAKGKERERFVRDDEGNEVFDTNGKRLTEKVTLEHSSVGAVQMFNIQQVVEGRVNGRLIAKTPIPALEASGRQPDLAGLNAAFAKSGMELRDAPPGKSSYISEQGKGAVYLSQADKSDDVAKAQVMVRGMAYKAMTLDTAGGWSKADSDITKYTKIQLRVELAGRLISDKFGVPTRPDRLDKFKEHIAATLDSINDKTGDRDQIRFAARDADRAVSRVLEGKWERSQERSRDQGQAHQQPAQQQAEPARQAQPPAQEQERQPDKAVRETKAPARSRAKGRAMERA